MTTVVELTVAFVRGAIQEGTTVERDRLRFFSSIESAEEWLRDHRGDPFGLGSEHAAEFSILWFAAFAGELDAPWEPVPVRYDARGNQVESWLQGPQPWGGRWPRDRRFSPGDAVLCAYDERLTCGSVEQCPPAPGQYADLDQGDDRYLVTFPDGGHDHVPEYQMWSASKTDRPAAAGE